MVMVENNRFGKERISAGCRQAATRWPRSRQRPV